MSGAPPLPGAKLTTGVLYRRVPNTEQWDYGRGRPTKMAFRPDKDELGRLDETVSMYLQSLTTPAEVVSGHPGYAVCAIDIADLIAAAIEKKETVVVTFSPTNEGPAGKAHCDVEGLFGPMQKALAKKLAVVVLAPGPPTTGIAAPSERD